MFESAGRRKRKVFCWNQQQDRQTDCLVRAAGVVGLARWLSGRSGKSEAIHWSAVDEKRRLKRGRGAEEEDRSGGKL